VKAGREENRLLEEPIVYFGVEYERGRERSWPTKEMEENSLFPYIASEILRLHQTHQIPFKEMAILIKDRYQAKRLQLHLSRWNISSTVKRTLSLAESRGFLWMEMLLKATLHPHDENAARAVMQGPLIRSKEPPFYALKQIFEEKGFAPFFSAFIHGYFACFSDPSLYEELKQTAEVLLQAHGASLCDLLHLMGALKEGNPEIDPRLRLRDEGEDKVPLMTAFASKGLEFEVVFSLGLASESNRDELDEEREAEEMRTLYVAFTRAKEKLYIPRLIDPKKGADSPIERFFEGIDVPIAWIEQREIAPFKKERERVELVEPKRLSLVFEKEYLTSYTAMAKPQHATLLGERFVLQDLSKKTPHTLPLGAETGTLIHALFETYFRDRTLSIEQICCEGLAGTHLEGWEEVVSEMVTDILQMPLRNDFSLSLLQPGEYLAEMEFLFPKEGQLVKGFADLVFQRDGIFYLLDWKTNWLGPSDSDYSQEKMERAMEEHDYYLQAKLYEEALLRYLHLFYDNPQFGGAYYLFVRGKKEIYVGNR
jgi:exodeoxyribonuclease V beta subunit